MLYHTISTVILNTHYYYYYRLLLIWPISSHITSGQARFPNPHVLQRRTTGDAWCRLFYRADALPVTNQQCQSTEGITAYTTQVIR